ncbi:MAG: hypothetical protein H6668_24420 [Ardenticatenaceae bacterium]|nr:hypothetical protein [Ardenticatenaceae bacterium]
MLKMMTATKREGEAEVEFPVGSGFKTKTLTKGGDDGAWLFLSQRSYASGLGVMNCMNLL